MLPEQYFQGLFVSVKRIHADRSLPESCAGRASSSWGCAAVAQFPKLGMPSDLELKDLEVCLALLHQPCPRIRDLSELREAMRDDRLPRRMRGGEFCWSLSFEPSFVSALLYEGFLPISSECGARLGLGTPLYVLQPKLHVHRCILEFPQLHVSRKTRKVAKRYRLTISTAFDDVLAACVQQHGENWLYPPMRRVLSSLSGVPQPRQRAAPEDPPPGKLGKGMQGDGELGEGQPGAGTPGPAAAEVPSKPSNPSTPLAISFELWSHSELDGQDEPTLDQSAGRRDGHSAGEGWAAEAVEGRSAATPSTTSAASWAPDAGEESIDEPSGAGGHRSGGRSDGGGGGGSSSSSISSSRRWP